MGPRSRSQVLQRPTKGNRQNAIIAEDLGVLTPDVLALRDEFHIPGTKVLQFAFDGNPDNVHLPENYIPNNVVYTGTHDNATSRGWFENLSDREQRRFWSHTGRPEDEIR